MTVDLQPDERETHLSMAGTEHGHWDVFTDDPYWIRRLEKLGIEPIRIVGAGCQYRLTADQVMIRKGKRHVSDATRTAMIERLQNSRTTGVLAG